jgi:xanthine dehydrogenase accessory factor
MHKDGPLALWRLVLAWQEAGIPVAIATVIATSGSVPRALASQMLIAADGRFAGAVSGGCIESHLIRQARSLLASPSPYPAQDLHFPAFKEPDIGQVGLACGGSIAVRLCSAPQIGFTQNFVQMLEQRQACTVELSQNGTYHLHQIPANSNLSCTHLAGDGNFYISYPPNIRLILIGGGDLSQNLAGLADLAGYSCILIDPRQDFLTPRRFPNGLLFADWPQHILPRLTLDEHTALVALSHDPKLDEPALLLALDSAAFYVGALGSHGLIAARQTRLLTSGLSQSALARLQSPAGLFLSGKSAAEISVSILAAIMVAHKPTAFKIHT